MLEKWINIWLKPQQTLYTKYYFESVFRLSLWFPCFCCANLLAWSWFYDLLVSCYRPKVWRPRLSPHRGLGLLQHTGWQIPARAQRACPADAAVPERKAALLASVTGRRPALWEWDVPLLGCLLHSSLNTDVMVLLHFVSELSEGTAGETGWDELYLVLPDVLSYFCMLGWSRSWSGRMWKWHLLSWAPCLNLPWLHLSFYI